jgi:predicted ATPase/class 3 adenylate cyclase
MLCGNVLATLGTAFEEVRKTVTVVFTDVTGFTSLGERLDAESLRLVMDAYFQEMRTILEIHGGTVEKFIGDAVVAVFGIPSLHEDDASRAVRAAVEMQASLEGLNDSLRRERGISLKVRIGVNTGEVVVTQHPGDSSLATGAAVILASRLEQAATPGQVLIGPATYDLLRDEVEVEPVYLRVKGKNEEVKAYRLLNVSKRPHAFAVRFDSPLVGREGQLEVLSKAFKGVLESRDCALATVIGAAGIGKSRLVKEFSNLVQLEATTLWGRCLPYGEGITLWPLSEIVMQAAGVREDETRDAAEGKLAAVLEGEDDASLICERVMGALGVGGAVHGTEEIFWAVRKLLQTLATKRPLIIVFDDIHWGESTFLDLVEYLGWSTRSTPIMVICIARPDLVEMRPGWGNASRNHIPVMLEPLPRADSDQLIANLLHGSDVPKSLQVRISEVGNGNPLFVEEMVRMWVDEGLVERRKNAWRVLGDPSLMSVPPTIQALLSARLDALPDEEKAVAQRGAIVGQVFWWGAVEELSPLKADVGTHLNSLVRKGFIEPCESLFLQEEAFAFRHILMRESAYQAVPKEAKAALHQRFADWLTRKTAGRLGEYEEILGYHLEQAFRFRADLRPVTQADLNVAEAAANRLSSAGQTAHARGDMPGTVNLFERCISLLGADHRYCVPLLPDLAAALVEIGQFGRADELLARALTMSKRLGDKAVENNVRLERIRLNLLTQAESLDDARRQTYEAIAACRELDDDAVLAKAWNLSGFIDLATGRAAGAEEAWQRAIAHARAAKRRKEETDSLYWLAIALEYGPTPADRAVGQCEEIVLAAADQQSVTAAALGSQGALEAMRGRIQEARTLAARAKAIYRELGSSVPAATSTMSFGLIETLGGQPENAERELRKGYDMLNVMDEKGFLSTVAAQLADVLCALGRQQEAKELTEMSAELAAVDDVTSQAMWRMARAKVLVEEGSLQEAEGLASEAQLLIKRTDFLNLHAQVLLRLATVLRARGRHEESLEINLEAATLFERKGNIVSAGKARAAVTNAPSSARSQAGTLRKEAPGNRVGKARASS